MARSPTRVGLSRQRWNRSAPTRCTLPLLLPLPLPQAGLGVMHAAALWSHSHVVGSADGACCGACGPHLPAAVPGAPPAALGAIEAVRHMAEDSGLRILIISNSSRRKEE